VIGHLLRASQQIREDVEKAIAGWVPAGVDSARVELYPTVKDLALETASEVFMAADPGPERKRLGDAFIDCTHAALSGLTIDYRAGSVEDLGGERFDLVTSMEVIEHVTDPAAFIAGLTGALAEGGLMVLSTPNRTLASRIAMITLGEGSGKIPKGTHDWDKFLKPDALEALLADAGMRVIDRRGLSFSPAKGFVLSDDLSLDYFLTAIRQ